MRRVHFVVEDADPVAQLADADADADAEHLLEESGAFPVVDFGLGTGEAGRAEVEVEVEATGTTEPMFGI